MREVLLDNKFCTFKYLDFEDLIKANNIKLFHKEKQIRGRKSYSFWREIVNQMKELNLIEKISLCKQIWNQMDNRNLFATSTQSRFDLESLALCLKESDECRGEK
jgi:hypothetical protein